jgi:uncharacterized protein (DUF2249 family)
MTSVGDILDVREEPKPERHALIFDRFQELGPGASFILVNDHDPKPLRRQFDARYPDAYSWDYREQGPEVWRVRIGKPEAGPPGEPTEANRIA